MRRRGRRWRRPWTKAAAAAAALNAFCFFLVVLYHAAVAAAATVEATAAIGSGGQPFPTTGPTWFFDRSSGGRSQRPFSFARPKFVVDAKKVKKENFY